MPSICSDIASGSPRQQALRPPMAEIPDAAEPLNDDHAVMKAVKKKAILCVNEDWFFLSHRLGLGLALADDGWEVVVSARENTHGDEIRAHGFGLAPLRLKRGSINPLLEIRNIVDMFQILAKERPDVVHLVGLKIILYGGFASLFFPKTRVLASVSGLGTIFTSKSGRLSLLRYAVYLALNVVLRLNRCQIIVQNLDDRRFFEGFITSDRIHLIPGNGIDTNAFIQLPEPPGDGPVVAAVVARMIGEKGIYECVEAARILHREGVNVVIRLVGKPDPENPSSIDEGILHDWQQEGVVELAGHQTDILDIWRNAHIALLPSHREGMPQSLLEGMSVGRPVVTTDAIGCREVIEDGVCGFIVPLRSPDAIADALRSLCEDPERRRAMGQSARKRVERIFSRDVIIDEFLNLYDTSRRRRSDT